MFPSSINWPSASQNTESSSSLFNNILRSSTLVNGAHISEDEKSLYPMLLAENLKEKSELKNIDENVNSSYSFGEELKDSTKSKYFKLVCLFYI